MVNIKKTVPLLLILFMIFTIYTNTAQSALTDEAKICLTCHSSKGISKTLENKEILSLYIEKDDFAKSVHNSIGCNGCHTGYMAAHVQKKKEIKSKKEYAMNAAKVCSLCHTDDKLKKIPMHSSLMAQASCIECHGSHYITSLAEWKKGINEAQYCLTCHRQQLSMRLESGESLSLAVNESGFKGSMHGKLLCSACHTEFSKTKHPVRAFKNKKAYTALATKSCLICHTYEQLRKSPVHSSLMAAATCVECHGSHLIRGIKIQKAAATETQYCLTCHRGRLSLTMRNGEALSVYINEASLSQSAHGKLQCTACHSEFSKTQHPVRKFDSIHEYSLLGAKLCEKCHKDAYSLYEKSIHYALFKSGNPKAPFCTGCHGAAHSIALTKTDRTIGLTSCNKCHGEMNSSYEASIHNKARLQGKANAPVCSSCHNAHDIQSTKMTTKIKEGCFKCHKNMGKIHDKWLNNPPIKMSSFAGTHFDVISCAACHSPNATRVIYLSLFDSKTGKPLTEEEVIQHLGTDTAGLMKKMDIDNDGVIEAKGLWNVFSELLGKGVRTTFSGKMDVSSAVEAHELGAKKEAVRKCEKCHHPDSEYFKHVFVVISKADGNTTVLPAKEKTLNSIYSILPARKFYAIGGTNIRLFDILFYIALLGGIAVPIGHLTLRIITSPLRSLKRMGKGGKK
jgi:predicted CXXCH cytochrome family protein